MKSEGKCPVVHRHTAAGALSNDDWWPDQLNLKILQQFLSCYIHAADTRADVLDGLRVAGITPIS